ncbi:MAG: aminotransferase class IV [Bdellovibrionales bacterium]|nr:aminotransferase class IV [Bdellovibrionales bacterium]
MSGLTVKSEKEVLEAMGALSAQRKTNYFAMYSSWLKGVTTDSRFMLLPIDDHIVHRGDAVFEAFRIHAGAIYDMKAHLDRLQASAKAIELPLPGSIEQIAHIIEETAKIAHQPQATVRLYVSRGPGGFTANPYETLGSGLYVVITPFAPLPEELYENGGKAGFAKTKMKESPWSAIKSCNYLQNVMMKKEAKDRGLDFTLSVSDEGYLGEGATENFAVIIGESLIAPPFDITLKGTTLRRVLDLAEKHKSELGLKEVTQRHVLKDELADFSEAFFIGTTVEVTPIVKLENSTIGDGKVGSRARGLRKLLQQDMTENTDFRHQVVNS